MRDYSAAWLKCASPCIEVCSKCELHDNCILATELLVNKEKGLNVLYDFSKSDIGVLTIVSKNSQHAFLLKVFDMLLENSHKIDFFEMDLEKLDHLLKGE